MTKFRAYDYINKRLKENYFHGEWQLLWYEPNPYFVLIVQTPLIEKSNQLLMNRQTVELSETLKNVYEFRLLFYDAHRFSLEAKDVIVSFPIHELEGMKQGDVNAMVMYVRRLQASIKLKWHEFITQYSNENFEITWEDSAFEAIKQSLIDQHRYSSEGMYFKE